MEKSGEYGLIADIGGTNARFALADRQGYYHEKIFKCDDFNCLEDAAEHYMGYIKSEGFNRPRSGAFAVAGPVNSDIFEAMNMPWRFSVSEVRNALGFEHLGLYNDFEAVAMGIMMLKDHDIRQAGRGSAKPFAPIGVIGPGTGLGVACLFYDGNSYHAVPTEGGHITVPALKEREFELFEILFHKYSHISAERVCSGKGIVNLYNAIIEKDGLSGYPERNAEEISALAMEEKCPVCMEVLDIMTDILGRVAGNLALTCGALGGIYIAGGIINKLGEYFYNSDFRTEFEAKGRLRFYMEQIPTFVVLHPHPAFLGLQSVL